MLRFEFKKYILKPSVPICLVLFILLNFVKFFEVYYYLGGGRYAMADETSASAYSEVYEKYGGEITNEKIEGLKAELSAAEQKLADRGVGGEPQEDCYTGYPYGDVQLLKNDFIAGYEYAILYPNTSNKIAALADENAEFYSGKSDHEVRKNELISSLYANRAVKHYVKPDGWTALFSYKFTTILSMLMLALTLSPVFSGERASGFDRLIKSSGKRNSAVRQKLFTAGIFTFAVTLIFFLVDVLYVAIFYGIDCFSAPICAIPEYSDCPFYFTLSGGLLLSFAGRLIAMFFFASVVMMISAFCGNTGVSLLSAVGAGAVSILLTELLPDALDPLSLVHLDGYFTVFSVENIFGSPVLTIIAAFVFTVILTAACVLVTVRRAMR